MPHKRWANFALVVGLTVIAVLIAGYSRGHTQRYDIHSAVLRTGGDPAVGKQKILQYGCPTCHTIPGIPIKHIAA